MKITLVRKGIFPITRDQYGNPLDQEPETGYNFPGTIQGEGKLAGIPVIFVRTSGCNLRCTWQTDSGEISICDAPYSSHYPDETEEWETDDIIQTIKTNLGEIRHIVITGGEPTIQPLVLIELVRKLKKQLHVHITLETNGIYYIRELTDWVDLFSISPKLKSSEPTSQKIKKLDHNIDSSYIRDHAKFRRNITTIQQYINACMHLESYYGDQPDTQPKKKSDKDFQLKFVIAAESDIKEIKTDFLQHLSFIHNDDIVLMPAGGNREFLFKTYQMTARLAVENAWRFTPRLQIDLFNDKQGV